MSNAALLVVDRPHSSLRSSSLSRNRRSIAERSEAPVVQPIALPPRTSTTAKILAFAARALQRIQMKIEERRARRALAAMGEGFFRDVGVSHGNVDWLASNGRDERGA